MKNLKEIEKKVYTSVYEDGIWDIFFGFMILGMGLSDWLEVIITGAGLPRIISSLFFPAFSVLIFSLGKKYITVPRMGYFEPSKKQRSNKRKLFGLLTITFLIGLGAMLLFSGINLSGETPEWKSWLGGYIVPIAITSMVVGTLSLMAYMMHFNRLYLIAILFGAAMFLTEITRSGLGVPLNSNISFGIAGTIVLLNGLRLFYNFLKKYPLPTEGKE